MSRAASKSIVAKVRAAAVSDRRSSLYLWMLANFDEFAATVAEAGRPNWGKLATTFGEEGLRDLKGKPPSPEAARLTWFKVRRAVSAQRGHKSSPVMQATVPPPVHPPVPHTRPEPGPEPEPPRERKPMVLRPARTIGPNESPQDDGSKLPKPFHRT